MCKTLKPYMPIDLKELMPSSLSMGSLKKSKKPEGSSFAFHGYIYKIEILLIFQTRIQYLITSQYIVYDMIVKSCPTFDNVFIEIDIAVVFHCKEDEEDIKRFAYNISIN